MSHITDPNGDIPAIRKELKGYVESDLPAPDMEAVKRSIEDAKAGRVSDVDEILKSAPDGEMIPLYDSVSMILNLLEVNDGYEPKKKPYVNLELSHRLHNTGEFFVTISAEWNDWRSMMFSDVSLSGALKAACDEKAKRKTAAAS